MKPIKLVCLLSLVGIALLHEVDSASAQQTRPKISANIPHGAVEYHVYRTAIARNLPGGEEAVYVYTPPGYDPKSSTQYPVLYLLHGWKQHSDSWTKTGDVNLTLDSLIAEGKAEPMLVVMPDGYGDYQFFRDSPLVWEEPNKISENVDLFSQMFLTEIVPKIESHYNVSKKREDRAIAGLSMGGLEALTIALQNPRMFAWVGGFSSAVQKTRLEQIADVNPMTMRYRLFWMAWGVSDPFVIRGNERLFAELRQSGVQVTANVIQGKHEWSVWGYDLRQFVPLLFQPKASD